ncbi:MAG: T9SS type A sorting domain-containing protein [Flavobacteriales bacterium]
MGVKLHDSAGNIISIPGGKLLSGAEISTGDATSANQGIMIVKHPLNYDDYYIFCTDDALLGQDFNYNTQGSQTPITRGLNYFVYKKNTKTVSGPTRIGSFRTTEQLAATFHANGKDIWVVTHESIPTGGNLNVFTQKYNAYLLTCSGIQSTPVSSSLGFPVQTTLDWQNHRRLDTERASLKFSWNGSKAAATHHNSTGTNYNMSVCLMDFNNATGEFSNSVAINPNDNAHLIPYSTEFSPSNNRLYVTYCSSPWDVPAVNGKVVYYDLTDNNNYHLVANLGTTIDAGTIKLGGDGKMYVGSFGSSPWGYRANIGAVSDVDGTPTFNANGVTVGGGRVGYGLSNLFVPPNDYLVNAKDTVLANCNSINLTSKWLCRASSSEDQDARWSGTGITNITDGIFDPNVSGSGTFLIEYKTCSATDTINITVNNCITGINNLDNNELTIYPNPSTGKFTFEVNKAEGKTIVIYNILGAVMMEQKITQSKSEITINQSGVYFYQVKENNEIQKMGKIVVK